MKLLCLGSSSKGNCYILKANNGNCLIIEAGVRFSEIKNAIDYKVNDIVGVLLSHSHTDHAGFANPTLTLKSFFGVFSGLNGG